MTANLAVMLIGGLLLHFLAFPGSAGADEAEAWSELKRLPQLPGPPHAVRSPNGRFALRAVPTASWGKEPPYHRLVLADRRTGERLDLLPIGRNVQIGWRTDGGLFFVNDNYGSDVADCRVFQLFEPHPLVSIAEAASNNLQVIPTDEQAILSGHLYFSCVKWLSSTMVLTVVYGHYDYPNAPAFKNRHLTYDVREHVLERVGKQ